MMDDRNPRHTTPVADPNNDPLGFGGQFASMDARPTHRLATARLCSPKKGLLIVTGIVLVVAVGGIFACQKTVGNQDLSQVEKLTSQNAKLEASNADLSKRLASLEDLTKRAYGCKFEDAGTPAVVPAAKPAVVPTTVVSGPKVATLAATPASAPQGTAGVLIGTLYHKSRRAQFKDEAASALAACAKDSEKIEVCFLEVGDTTHARFETSAVAVNQSGISQKRAGELNACLHDKLPKLVRKDDAGNVVKGDDDKPETVKVATAVVDIGTGRYEGKGCSLE